MKKGKYAIYIVLSVFICFISCQRYRGTGADDRIFGVYRLYPENVSSPGLPPQGYEPVYISHYGRHGSRFILYDSQYVYVNNILKKAYEEGMLTKKGCRLYRKFKTLYPQLEGKAGILTPLGCRQQERIADRMYDNYSSLLDSNAVVMAFSTGTQRTVESMISFCGALKKRSPYIDIDTSSALCHTKYINPYSSKSGVATAEDLEYKSLQAWWRPEFDEFCKKTVDPVPFIKRLFKDCNYVQENFSVINFMRDLYSVAIHLPGVPCKDDLMSVFSKDELVSLAKCDNYTFYVEKGPWPAGGGRNWRLSAFILEDIIEKAVTDMYSGDVSARLRFGHDGCIMALLALMKIEPWCQSTMESGRFWNVWNVSDIPMASNLYFVFYESPDSFPIVRALHNEVPVKLPLEEVYGGFYKTRDFIEYFRELYLVNKNNL